MIGKFFFFFLRLVSIHIFVQLLPRFKERLPGPGLLNPDFSLEKTARPTAPHLRSLAFGVAWRAATHLSGDSGVNPAIGGTMCGFCNPIAKSGLKAGVFLSCSVPVFLPFLHAGLMWWYLLFLSGIAVFFEGLAEYWKERYKDPDAVFVLTEIFFLLAFLWISFWAAAFIRSTWFSVSEGPAFFFFGNSFLFAGAGCLLFWHAFSKIRRQLKRQSVPS